jgi:thiol-disulfide isomerase/thioredoxin
MSWTATTLKILKSFVAGLLVLLFIWFLYRFTMRLLFKKTVAPVTAPVFSESDSVRLSGLQKGFVVELDSDKTADAVLSGSFGPAVVQFYAPWCSHCKNMSEFYEAAAKASDVPFVRVLGSACPVTVAKYGVAGYPTVFGVSGSGGPIRFGSSRTKEAFVDFARSLVAVVAPAQPVMPYAPVQPPPNMASIIAALPATNPATNVTVYQPVPQVVPVPQVPQGLPVLPLPQVIDLDTETRV